MGMESTVQQTLDREGVKIKRRRWKFKFKVKGNCFIL